MNSRDEGNMYYGALFPDAPSIFEDDASLQALWKGPKRVFLWVEEDNVPLFVKQSGSYQLARSGGKLILMNRTLPRKSVALQQFERYWQAIVTTSFGIHRLGFKPGRNRLSFQRGR